MALTERTACGLPAARIRRSAEGSSTGASDTRPVLAIRELRKVAWRGPRACERYLGYLALTDEAVRLSGRDEATRVDVALSIPHEALRSVRACEGTVVLELVDGEIVVEPVDGSTAEVERLAHRLTAAVEPPTARRRVSRRR